jgi:hypothetical protein
VTVQLHLDVVSAKVTRCLLDGFGLPVKTFSAQDALAKYMVVIPDCGLVVVYLNHAELPDNASAMFAAELETLPTISKSQMSHLLQRLVEAQQRTGPAGPGVARRSWALGSTVAGSARFR